MQFFLSRLPFKHRAICVAAALTGVISLPAHAQLLGGNIGDLLVSSTNYFDPSFSTGAALPISTGATAVAGSGFCTTSNCSGNVWSNASVDGNFGTSSDIILQSVNATTGAVNGTVNVTSLAASQGLNLVTSFASKSELGLNVTPDGKSITFMGYSTTSGRLDVSNSATPGVAEAGNTDTATATYRGVAQINLLNGGVQYTATNAYSGNNGRAAVLGANGNYYTVGNAGNGNGGTGITNGTGVQLIVPGSAPGTNSIGAFNITQYGYGADKTAKDSNYRGLTVFNNTLYVSKGSGGNGINTVYQVGAAGTLPTGAGSATPVSILPGFNTTLAKNAMTPHPFGLFFADSKTLYVADEGSGAMTDFGAAPTTLAGGLQKYSLVNGTWTLDYTLKGSLIGSSYTVNGAGSLAGDSLTPTVDGLRNLTGRVNADGTVTLYAATSTAGSALGDAGADPNLLVAITDNLAATTAGQVSGEDFTVLQTAALGSAIRGVAINPVPEPESYALAFTALGLLGAVARRRKSA